MVDFANFLKVSIDCVRFYQWYSFEHAHFIKFFFQFCCILHVLISETFRVDNITLVLIEDGFCRLALHKICRPVAFRVHTRDCYTVKTTFRVHYLADLLLFFVIESCILRPVYTDVCAQIKHKVKMTHETTMKDINSDHSPSTYGYLIGGITTE